MFMPGHKLIRVIITDFILGWANIFWRVGLIADLAVSMHFIVTLCIFRLCHSTSLCSCCLFFHCTVLALCCCSFVFLVLQMNTLQFRLLSQMISGIHFACFGLSQGWPTCGACAMRGALAM